MYNSKDITYKCICYRKWTFIIQLGKLKTISLIISSVPVYFHVGINRWLIIKKEWLFIKIKCST